jgi:acyl-coenzyme A thioesterase PaaI-like protein
MCIVCSPQNPNGLKLKFAAQPDGSVLAVFDCRPVLESYPGVLHGGVIAAILDSAMLYALFAIDVVAVTAAIEVHYLAPTSTRRFATVRGWTENASSHPLYAQRAQLIQDGKLRVEAHGSFIVPGAL